MEEFMEITRKFENGEFCLPQAQFVSAENPIFNHLVLDLARIEDYDLKD